MKKNPLFSKTIWLNLLILSGGVLSYLSGHDLIVNNPAAVSILTIAVGVVNVVLRFVTKDPVK